MRLPVALLALLLALTSGVLLSTGDQTAVPVDDDKRQWVEMISWQPRAQVYHNFITPEECDHIVELARPRLRQSTVVGEGGKSVLDTVRTSRGTFLRRNRTPTLAAVEKRLELWSHHNVSLQEDMQVLRYSNFQKYGAHMDVLEEDTPRAATVLIYLSDVEEGGETAFPAGSAWADSSGAMEARFGPFSDCARGHVAVRPKKGSALIFYSLDPDMKTQDSHSTHTGCPVIRGVKWTATIWIHTAPFRPESYHEEAGDWDSEAMPEDCENDHKQCEEWAGIGECKKNAGYMVGDAGGFGSCRKACKVCEDCAASDAACRARNRLAAGFPALDDLT